jgi:hypothetical protein
MMKILASRWEADFSIRICDMSGTNPEYDVFISYKSEYKPWVETLARNLSQQGLIVWLDDWRKRPGDLVAGTLDKAINNSKAGVLVVTPEAVASGWVQEEYASMLNREKLGHFRLIPVILRESEAVPFLKNRFWIDFTNPENYRRRFYELVQGVRGCVPDPMEEIEGAIEPPPPLPDIARISHEGELALFKGVFDELDEMGVMLLFAQEGMGAGGSDVLVEQARLRFGEANVFHIVPIVCAEEEAEDYFIDVARQLGLSNDVRAAPALASNLPKLLTGKRKVLLVLSNFENGPKAARHKLASALRTFVEQERRKVRIVIRGGEELAAMKYEMDDVSLLNLAGTRLWPDLTEDDVDSLFKQRKPGQALKAGEALSILTATGAEPRLVGHCLRHRANVKGESSVDYEQVVRAYDIATPWFVPIKRREADASRVRRLLADVDLGAYATPWFSDAITRRLFWRNAFAVHEIEGRTRMRWRCEALREAGRTILECA